MRACVLLLLALSGLQPVLARAEIVTFYFNGHIRELTDNGEQFWLTKNVDGKDLTVGDTYSGQISIDASVPRANDGSWQSNFPGAVTSFTMSYAKSGFQFAQTSPGTVTRINDYFYNVFYGNSQDATNTLAANFAMSMWRSDNPQPEMDVPTDPAQWAYVSTNVVFANSIFVMNTIDRLSLSPIEPPIDVPPPSPAPVPEPESYAMLLVGLALAGGMARVRQQRA